MSRKRKIASDDLEPTIKLTSDGDLLVKQLLEKQLSKETNLQEEFQDRKEFISSTEYLPISNFISGINTLETFEATTKNCQDFEQLKLAGLDNENINFFMNSKKGQEYLKMRYKNLNPRVIEERLLNIHSLLDNYHQRSNDDITSTSTKTSRHQTEFMLSIKPHSVETALLKFALNNEKKNNDVTSMNSFKSLDEDMMNSLQYMRRPNIPKILKRARNLRNQIETMKFVVEEPGKHMLPQYKSFVENSKWDVKTPDQDEAIRINKPQKLYSCATIAPSNIYTIEDGNIKKLNDNLENANIINTQYKKLSLEELKQIPKFAQYDRGIPSKILYIKNLSSVSTDDIKNLFKSFNFQFESIKILKGRMRGQAFIEMKNSEIAERALTCMNGIILKNRPLIIEFGRRDKEPLSDSGR